MGIVLATSLTVACGSTATHHGGADGDDGAEVDSAANAGGDPCASTGDGLNAYFAARTEPLDPSVLERLAHYELAVESYGIKDRMIQVKVTTADELPCLPQGYVAQLKNDLDLGGKNIDFKRELNNVILDGASHVVANYVINQRGGGLLATAFSSVFMDLKLEHVRSELKAPYDDVIFGGAMGTFLGVLSGGCVCGVSAEDVELSTLVGGVPQIVGLGGLVGSVSGPTSSAAGKPATIIRDVTVRAKLQGFSGGGIVSGASYATLKGVTAHVDFNKDTTIAPTALGYVGGVVGYADDGNVVSTASADGSLVGNDGVGGIAGGTDVGNTFTDVHFSGEVRGATHVAGLVGQLYAPYNANPPSKIEHATCDGRVSGTGVVAADATEHYFAGVITDVDCSKMAVAGGPP
jgi:hypothetical protein